MLIIAATSTVSPKSLWIKSKITYSCCQVAVDAVMLCLYLGILLPTTCIPATTDPEWTLARSWTLSVGRWGILITAEEP